MAEITVVLSDFEWSRLQIYLTDDAMRNELGLYKDEIEECLQRAFGLGVCFGIGKAVRMNAAK